MNKATNPGELIANEKISRETFSVAMGQLGINIPASLIPSPALMRMEEALHKLRQLTGLSAEEIKAHMVQISSSAQECVPFCQAFGRLPSQDELRVPPFMFPIGYH